MLPRPTGRSEIRCLSYLLMICLPCFLTDPKWIQFPTNCTSTHGWWWRLTSFRVLAIVCIDCHCDRISKECVRPELSNFRLLGSRHKALTLSISHTELHFINSPLVLEREHRHQGDTAHKNYTSTGGLHGHTEFLRLGPASASSSSRDRSCENSWPSQ